MEWFGADFKCADLETLVRLEVFKVHKVDFVLPIIIFMGMSTLFYSGFKNSAMKMIKEIGTISRFYPKHYIKPKRWIRKLFEIQQQEIPRYLYFELLLSLFFAILGPLDIAISVISGLDKDVMGVLVLLYFCLGIIDTIFFSIISWLFKKK